MASDIGRLVEEAARDRPSELAVAEGRTGDVLTWGRLGSVVGAWGEGSGGPGRLVALVAERPLHFVEAYLGLLASGAVVLPLDPSAPEAEMVAAMAGFGVSAVATDSPAGRRAAEAAGLDVWPIPHPEQVRLAGEAGEPVTWAEPGTVVLRSSGTTGTPKGVPLGEARLLRAARCVGRHHRLTRADRVYSSLPLFHINAQVVGLLAAVVSGAGLVVDDRFHRSGFWDVVGEWDATVLNAVPAILAILAEEEPPPEAVSRRLRFARSASAPLPLATLARFEERCGIGVLETYGMTEAAGQICANPLHPGDRRPGSVGRPVGIELRVVDEAGSPVGDSVSGFVEIRGPSVTPRYVIPAGPGGLEVPGGRGGCPALRPACGPSGWLRTGDAGYRDAGGFVYLMGRTDGVINRGGEKVYPREVEEVLRLHAAVAEAAVVGEPDPVLGQRPVAFVVPRSPGAGAGLTSELLELCRRELGRHKQPARIHVMASLPATPTGKVRHDKLRALAGQPGPVPVSQ